MTELDRRNFLEALIASAFLTIIPKTTSFATEISFNTFTIAKPSCTQKGDILFCVSNFIGTEKEKLVLNGFTEIPSDKGYSLSYKIAKEQEPDFYTFNDHGNKIMFCIRGTEKVEVIGTSFTEPLKG